MPFEEMQRIADEMTAQGIPLVLDRYYRGLEDAIDRMADGDPLRLEQLQEKFSSLIQIEGTTLRPVWRVTRRGRASLGEDDQPLDWTSTRPNTYGLPTEVLGAIDGWRVMLYQQQMYTLALVAGNKEWTDHYEAGGDLWDKVQEALGVTGPVTTNTRQGFWRLVCSRHDSMGRYFPWLCQKMEELEKLTEGEVRTAAGARVPAENVRARLWMVSLWTAKELLRDGILEAYGSTGSVPYLIHHDGVVVHKDLLSDYSASLTRGGLRLVPQDGASGSSLAPRRALTRFDVIDELG